VWEQNAADPRRRVEPLVPSNAVDHRNARVPTGANQRPRHQIRVALGEKLAKYRDDLDTLRDVLEREMLAAEDMLYKRVPAPAIQRRT
jgi:hypothetical protein